MKKKVKRIKINKNIRGNNKMSRIKKKFQHFLVVHYGLMKSIYKIK